MQNFLNIERIEQKKRNVLERVRDYSEIYARFENDEAQPQADRCVQCGDPYCHNKCPLHNYIPHWLKKTSEKDLEVAFKISNFSSPFPEITGRVCPQDKLCEGDCTLSQDGYGAINIGAIETYITEEGLKKGLSLISKPAKTGHKVAVVGSGPAGISAATFLLRAGIDVDMYESADRAGGLLTYGIPGFKLEKSVVERRFEILKEMGLTLFLGKTIGKDIAFEELEKNYASVFLGIGAKKSKSSDLPNEEAKGSFWAIDFLTNIQRKNFGLSYDKRMDVRLKDIVVIGGGDTAMDCVRSSIREGAKSVKVLYRRDASNMPGSKKEYKNAQEEGVEFLFMSAPKEILIDGEKNIRGLIVQKTELGCKDESGRQSCEVIAGSDFELKADMVIFSLGFDCEKPEFLAKNGIETDKYGRITINSEYRTTNEKVYAGGDCYRGAHLVVTAAFDGREAAKNIIKRLLIDSE